jgi:transposase-like protein
MSKGIRFTDECKQDAVAQVVERGYAASEVAGRRVMAQDLASMRTSHSSENDQ